MDNYFAQLNSVNVNSMTEKKNGLTYLSWAWAWGELKSRFPDATYTIYEDARGFFYHTDGRTCWVKTGVTVAGIEHIEYLPVMDFRNASIPADKVTSYDVNKTIQRSLTKAVARHGLGLYVYAGEDLPEGEDLKQTQEPAKAPAKQKAAAMPPKEPPMTIALCQDCNKIISDHGDFTAAKIVEKTVASYGRPLCWECAINARAQKEAAK